MNMTKEKWWGRQQLPFQYTEQQHLNESGGVHCYASPLFICVTAVQFHIQATATAQVGSFHGIILIYDMTVVFYISLQPPYGMVIRLKGNCTMDYATVPGQGVCVVEA